ncbi:MAG TPA: ATP-binding cassette domain-containing protein [Acidimicrobiales bacterium]|nr:ATP-binding cassette domain-containing protein [Acidimicrobiales bacterium]
MARPILEVRDLCVVSGSTTACRDINFTVHAGEVLGILGAEGAGKSQLLRCIGLDFPPSSGTIFLRGSDVTGASSQRRRQLRARTIELVHPPAPAGQPDSTVPGTRTGVLLGASSGPTAPVAGMRQRIQIAKALAHRADALLLDEPFVGVEHGVRGRILELLQRLRTETETAVVVATRHPEVARAVADEILVLVDGEVVETGPAHHILETPRDHRTRSLVQDRRSA